MSISSDVTITRKKAESLVKDQLMNDYEHIVDLAIKTMEDCELTSKLHTERYFYSIGDEE